MRWLPAILLLGGLALLAPSPADAQIRASELASMTQTIDGTEIRIEYYRPRARGRAPLFGGEEAVVWEPIWTPGANWSTKLSFQKPITINGVSVEPGTYGVWIDMDDGLMPEEFFLEPDTMIFHTQGPPPRDEQIRFPIELEDAPHFSELLTWDFVDYSTSVQGSTGTLAMHWGDHWIPLEIEVEPSMTMTTTAEQAANVVGTYEVRMAMGPPDGTGDPEWSPPFRITVSWDEETGILHSDWEGHEDPWFNETEFWLLPTAAEGFFMPGEVYDGVFTESWADIRAEFEIDGPSRTISYADPLGTFVEGTRVGN
jgi:hypothetical protein